MPPFDLHEYIDLITVDSATGDEEARDAEMEALAKWCCAKKQLDPKLFQTRLSVRRNLLGHWSDDNHSSFSLERVIQLRKAVVPLIKALDEHQKERLEQQFDL